MPNQNSNEYQSAFIDEPKSQLLPQFRDGRIRRIYAEVDVPAASEFLVGEQIFIQELPANSVIIQTKLVSPDLGGGAGGTLELGWEAGSEGLEAADSDGILAAVATDGGAINAESAFSDAAFNKRFQEPVLISGTFGVAATTSASGNTIQVEILYVID